jgi:endonuclease/exonuclease/phosphatase family metal-dependent hydrolase
VQPGEGDMQILDIVCRGHQQVQVVNVYDALQTSDQVRPARAVEWSRVITQGTILAGDFNAHSRHWNPHCDAPLHHRFMEDLMDVHDLQYVGDGKETHSQSR